MASTKPADMPLVHFRTHRVVIHGGPWLLAGGMTRGRMRGGYAMFVSGWRDVRSIL